MLARSLCALALLAATSAPARAEEDRDTRLSKMHFQRGSQLYSDGDYRQALAEFEAAHMARPLAAFLYNVAQCYERLERREEAVRAYQAYLAAGPAAEDVPIVQRRIKELRELIAASQAGRERPKPRPQRLVTWLVGGGAVALGIAGGVSLGVAADRFGAAQATCRPACSDAVVGDIEAAANVGYVLLVGAALAAGAAVVTFFLERRQPQEAARAALAPGRLEIRF